MDKACVVLLCNLHKELLNDGRAGAESGKGPDAAAVHQVCT